MASIIKRGGVWHIYYRCGGKKYRYSLQTDNDPDADDKTLAIVDVAKNRNGPICEVRLNFEDTLTRFADRAEIADYIRMGLF